MMTEFLLLTLFPNSLISLMQQSARWQRWVPVIQRHTTFWRGFFLPPPFAYPVLCPHLDTQTGSEEGLIQKKKKMRGLALLSALHQETECERTARHHTEAALKNTCIPLLISYWWPLLPLCLWGERPPCGPDSDPEDPLGCARNCLFPLIEPSFKSNHSVHILPHV